MFERWKQKQQVLGMKKLLERQIKYRKDRQAEHVNVRTILHLILQGWKLEDIAKNPVPTDKE